MYFSDFLEFLFGIANRENRFAGFTTYFMTFSGLQASKIIWKNDRLFVTKIEP